MAATNFTPIQLYRTTTAAAVPVNTNLADGELAINTTDEKLYFKNAGGTVKLLAANLTPIANGGSGTTTAQLAMNAFAGAVTSGSYLRGNGTNVVMNTIQAGDVPTLNQNTTGTAANLSGTPTLPSGTTLVAPVLGTPASGNLANCTFPTLNQNTSGTAAGLSTTLAISSGGTGLTTTPANGALDIGNGTGFTRTTLTAGTGVSISNTSGAISISATGSGGTVTSVGATAPVASSGGNTPTISMAAASSGVNGYMTGTYATKLDGIAAGATNVTNTNQLTNGAGFLTSAVTSVSGTAPVSSSGGNTPAISMAAATASVNGYMTSTYAGKLDGIAAGATNVTNTNQLTNGAGFITAAGNTFTGAQIYSDQQLSRGMMLDFGNVVVDKGNISNATVTFDYAGGSVQTFTATGTTVTWAFSNWPPTGNLGELLVLATNAGAYTQAISGVTWILPNGTTSTSLATYLAANTGRTAFQTSGVDQVLFWSRNAGTTIYGKLI